MQEEMSEGSQKGRTSSYQRSVEKALAGVVHWSRGMILASGVRGPGSNPGQVQVILWASLVRRSSQSILKEVSSGCSLQGLMLKLKLQYFGHLM